MTANCGDNQARLVTTDSRGALKIGPPLAVNGSRLAIYPIQITPAVVEQLASLIAARGGVALARLSRFVLAIHGSTAGWDVYPISGRIRFEAPLQGESLSVITKNGKRKLS